MIAAARGFNDSCISAVSSFAIWLCAVMGLLANAYEITEMHTPRNERIGLQDNIQKNTRQLQQGISWDTYNQSQFIHLNDDVERIAVILTGELRSANLTWTSGHIRSNGYAANFGPEDPFSPASTIIEWMLKPLGLTYGIDVFMFQTAKPQLANKEWDGQPHTYENKVGDTAGCEIFSKSELFHGTGNKFFCMIEEEKPLMNNFIRQYPRWNRNGNMKYIHPEQILQQLYALWKGNMGAKQYAEANGITYKLKMRVRPDMAVVKHFPPISNLDFGPQPLGRCKATIWYANKKFYANGAEDSFNIGPANAMDRLLDRYLDFISAPFVTRVDDTAEWNLEDHLMGLMNKRYKICMEWYYDIWMVVIRKDSHQYKSEWVQDPSQHLLWKELSR